MRYRVAANVIYELSSLVWRISDLIEFQCRTRRGRRGDRTRYVEQGWPSWKDFFVVVWKNRDSLGSSSSSSFSGKPGSGMLADRMLMCGTAMSRS